MYDNMTVEELRARLELVEAQRRIAVEQLDLTRSDLRIEKARAAYLEARLAVERAHALALRSAMRFW